MQVLHTLGRVGRMLQDVLRPADAAELAAALLDHVSEALVADILGRRDIGVDDCHEISMLLKPLAEEGLAKVLPAPGEVAEGEKGQVRGQGWCVCLLCVARLGVHVYDWCMCMLCECCMCAQSGACKCGH